MPRNPNENRTPSEDAADEARILASTRLHPSAQQPMPGLAEQTAQRMSHNDLAMALDATAYRVGAYPRHDRDAILREAARRLRSLSDGIDDVGR